ncbi:unnamed protein product [Allacma fusca]|uniref:3'-5' exonuclease domain-containing protein n=1 Tax=Allacma fusca TaxID=39272 RepID=A0A8J2NZH7_9HEXA|nr:unnamed protein product [Allacma fusca]
MMQETKDECTLGFDIDGHMQYSIGNIISLMQISTFKKDFLVDPFTLHDEIRSELKLKIEDPGTLLIVHGGANDILWLKGEFKIFPLCV